MKIGFTGHRDKHALLAQLVQLKFNYHDATWGHGNAKNGFDKQVDNFIVSRRLLCVRFDPKPETIDKIGYVGALLARDKELVDWLDGTEDILVALYDGRKSGGTFYTLNYAEKLERKIIRWTP